MKKSILFSAVVAAILVGCGDKGGESTTVNDAINSAVAKTKEVAKDTTAVAVDSAKEVTKEAVQKSVEATKEVATKAVEKVKEVATPVVEKAKESVEQTVEKAKEAVTTTVASSADGATIYKTCSACHGANGEKKALGKSQIITGWDASKTETALNGYKDGSYGGAMKGVMAGQAKKLSDSDVKAVAAYISTLK